MRLEIIIDRAKATGLPLAKDAFRETKENPLPVPPYLVYIVPQVVGRGSDERILLHIYTSGLTSGVQYVWAWLDTGQCRPAEL